MGRPETFTKHDVGVIKKYYAKIPTKQLVGMMENSDKTERQIRGKANMMGLRKDYELTTIQPYPNNELTLQEKDVFRKENAQIVGARKTYLNDHYFDVIDSDEKAYWLGFLYADGYIYQRKNKNGTYSEHFELGLSTEDLDHMKKFRYCVGCNKDIKFKHVKFNRKNYESCKLTIYGHDFVNSLMAKGVVPRKSLILTFPTEQQVPRKFHSAFIRGYFDGDGCVYGNNHTNVYQISMVGTYDFLAAVQDIICENTTMNHVEMHKKWRAYQLNWGGFNNLKSIYQYLYKDSSISLNRKRTVFERTLETKTFQNPNIA